MGRIIITHVGASLLEDSRALKNAELHDSLGGAGSPLILKNLRAKFSGRGVRALSDEPKEVERWGRALIGCLFAITLSGKDKLAQRQEAPAEIHSLHQLKLTTDDRVVLVCSSNDEGRFCGRLIRYVLSNSRPNGFVPSGAAMPSDIDGLTGVDAKSAGAFVDKGLPEYANIVAREYQLLKQKDTPYDSIIFNVTGGYKGIIPFATIAAQLLNAHASYRGLRAQDQAVASIVYVHEDATELVQFEPNLPVQWGDDDGLTPLIRNIAFEVQKNGGALPSDPFKGLLYALRQVLV